MNQHPVDRTEELARSNAEGAFTNKDLRQFREQQRLLFDSIPYPVWVYELDTLAIKDVNESAIRSYGYSREEFLSRTIRDLRPAEDIPALLGNMSEHHRTETGGRGVPRERGTARPIGPGSQGLRNSDARPGGPGNHLERGAERIKGYRAEEIIGKHFSPRATVLEIKSALSRQE